MSPGDGGSAFAVRAVGNAVWVQQAGWCSGDPAAAIVSAISPDGSSRVVFPSPFGEPSDGDDWWARGLTSWAVAQ